MRFVRPDAIVIFEGVDMVEYLINFAYDVAPDSWTGKAVLALLPVAVGSFFIWVWNKTSRYIPGTEEYQLRVEAQRILDAAAKQDNEVVFTRSVNGTQVKLFSGDITQSSAQIIVSSDDTLLSATGGVAKSIVSLAGKNVKARLKAISKQNVSRGTIAITDGGNTGYRYIFHAIVLTKARDHTEYPTKKEVELLLRRILDAADAIGVESISLPILAGGTASKKLKEEGLGSHQEVIRFIIESISRSLASKRNQLKSVFVVEYDNRHLTGDFVSLLRSSHADESA
jgi:O-acetyl-ADP-ribose deacetylase (regulator of RNase III)